MNNVPRQMLRRIVAKYGADLGGNRRRCEGLLKDLCGAYRREINVLTSAIEERVPLDLLAAGSTPRELLLTRLAKRLEDNHGLTAEASAWAVDSWALALGVLTDEEVEAREKIQNDSAARISPPPVQPPPAKPKIQSPTPPQNRQAQPKPQPPKIYLPAMPAPANLPTRQPASNRNAPVPQTTPQNLPASNPANNSASNSANNPAKNPSVNVAPRRLFRRFFGCLFVLFLLAATGVVLFFGVPYAIEVMRDTQRQNEPPRFPPQ